MSLFNINITKSRNESQILTKDKIESQQILTWVESYCAVLIHWSSSQKSKHGALETTGFTNEDTQNNDQY